MVRLSPRQSWKRSIRHRPSTASLTIKIRNQRRRIRRWEWLRILRAKGSALSHRLPEDERIDPDSHWRFRSNGPCLDSQTLRHLVWGWLLLDGEGAQGLKPFIPVLEQSFASKWAQDNSWMWNQCKQWVPPLSKVHWNPAPLRRHPLQQKIQVQDRRFRPEKLLPNWWESGNLQEKTGSRGQRCVIQEELRLQQSNRTLHWCVGRLGHRHCAHTLRRDFPRHGEI